jgi:hypothetical protein
MKLQPAERSNRQNCDGLDLALRLLSHVTSPISQMVRSIAPIPKVPGVLDWSTGVYNPRVDITQDTTTLYASDRDVFLFLVDDLNPIEAGRLCAFS